MARIKLSSLVNCENDLQTFLSYRFKMATAFRLIERTRSIIEKLESWHKTRETLFRELGEEKEGGLQIKPENMPRFLTETNELMDMEVEIPLPILTFDEVKAGAVSDEISPMLLIRLREFVFNQESPKGAQP